jgi:hypothetical protein
MNDNRLLTNDISCCGFHSLTVFLNYKYCQKYNYDFKYLRSGLDGHFSEPYANCVSPRGDIRHASWSKILASKKLIKEYPNYDYYVYLDTDCIFNNFNIFSLYKIHNRIHINNLAIKVNRDDSFRSFCYTFFYRLSFLC